ncbi:MAG: polyprenyl synthetase family protein [Oenococcus sp.]|uniref:polyprenyl synthetase family protein n=1 Tax=Oenococcus TaxID=46254 RepID=UPI0021E832F9|nr:polyprenyl synthetase family protein [Oenococcus kitaharae]MCV3296052.1 polyprenyl synthetase family protein [Oenococcus kitaharae]
MKFEVFSDRYLPKINQELKAYFSDRDDDIFDMISYALNSAGKRLRPLITLAVYAAAGKVIDDTAIKAATAVEFVHAYSLVHDDLPEMDNDSKRRGQDSVWKTYGVGNAVLVGDGLLTEAFKKLADLPIPDSLRLRLIYSLALAAGPDNMVRGQQYDLFSKEKVQSVEDLEFVHLMKTGSLMTYAATAGGILAGLPENALRYLNVYGANLGIAFQIKDDLKDIEQDKAEHKNSFPKLAGVDGSQAELAEHVKAAREAIEKIPNFQHSVLTDLLDQL